MRGSKYSKGLSRDLLDFLNDLNSKTKTFLKREIRLTDGVRTYAQQKYLWTNRHNNPYPVGHPDKNLPHYTGDAVDVSWNDFSDVRDVYTQAIRKALANHPNIAWGGDRKRFDPIHFYLKDRSKKKPKPSGYKALALAAAIGFGIYFLKKTAR